MKKIKLPSSYRIDLSKIDQSQKNETIFLNPIIEVVNTNRLEIINAGNELENKFNAIIKFYFFGNNIYKSVKRDEFEPMVLGKSWFTLNAKKNLIIEIMNDLNVPSGKDKEEFEKSLRRFIEARNIFAHGHLTLVEEFKVELGYFNGDKNSIDLDDNYFNDLIEVVSKCFKYTEEIGKFLNVGFWQENEKELYN